MREHEHRTKKIEVFSAEEKDLLISRFQKLVTFLPSQTMPHTLGAIERAFLPYASFYSRYCGIHRLPNVLLFAIDTVGLDYSPAFIASIIPSSSKTRFSEYAEIANQAFSFSGRSLNPGEHTQSNNEVVHVSSPGVTDNALNFVNRGAGCTMLFYDPKIIKGLHVGAQLYRRPPPEALQKIFIAWPEEFYVEGIKS